MDYHKLTLPTPDGRPWFYGMVNFVERESSLLDGNLFLPFEEFRDQVEGDKER